MENRRFTRLITALLITLTLAPSTSLALSSDQLHSIQFDAVYYDKSAVKCGASNVNLNGNDNIQKAFNYFVSQGLTPAQSAGIVGNFIQESNVNPTSTNSIGAHGIAQWLNGRRTALEDFASSKGLPEDDLATQLAFAWQELTTGYQNSTLDPLKATSDVNEAAKIVFDKYEGAGDSSLPARQTDAQGVLQLYGGSAGGATATSASGSCVGNGQNSQYVDGFLVYSQYDPTWKDHPYSTSTIGASGCGPSAMAMIITALTGTSVTPIDTADYAASQGIYVSGVGSSWSIGPVLAQHWGLKSEAVGADASKIAATLQAGGLVIISGQGSLPFTSAGHFIVIRGVTADGKFKVGDSAHNETNSQEWDPQQLLSQANGGSAYAITK